MNDAEHREQVIREALQEYVTMKEVLLVTGWVMGVMAGFFGMSLVMDRLMTKAGRWLAMEEEDEYDADYDDYVDGVRG